MSNPYHAETVLIEGPDAATFAHAQFSSKVSTLAIGQWQFSAWLDPQGRVRALFHLARVADDRFFLLLRGGSAKDFAAALSRYVLRAKLMLTAQPTRCLTTGPASPMHAVRDDGDVLVLGCATHSLLIGAATASDSAWRLPQLHAGWPWLPTRQQDNLLPTSLSLLRLHAVEVDKGCYPGQEIIARLHFRGGHKRHLHSVTLSQPANPGEALLSGDRDVGCLLDVVTTKERIEALVVLSDDIVASASDGQLNSINDQAVIQLMASWSA